MRGTTPALLRRTHVTSAAAVLAVAHWMFGNLYEQVVTMPPTLADPVPADLVGASELGSPLWYYGASLPVTLALTWLLAIRLRRAPDGWHGPRPAAWATRAAASVTVAVALKVLLITSVNPTFRDPGVAAGTVRDMAIVWLVGNGTVVVLLTAAIVCLTWWRVPSPLVDRQVVEAPPPGVAIS